jgi:hypothetical protein
MFLINYKRIKKKKRKKKESIIKNERKDKSIKKDLVSLHLKNFDHNNSFLSGLLHGLFSRHRTIAP